MLPSIESFKLMCHDDVTLSVFNRSPALVEAGAQRGHARMRVKQACMQATWVDSLR